MAKISNMVVNVSIDDDILKQLLDKIADLQSQISELTNTVLVLKSDFDIRNYPGSPQ